jgi:hypothetical protein
VAELKRSAGAQTVHFLIDDSTGDSTGDGADIALSGLAGVSRVERQRERVTLTTNDADITVRALVGSAIDWRNLEVRSPNLDEIFMALVGNGK